MEMLRDVCCVDVKNESEPNDFDDDFDQKDDVSFNNDNECDLFADDSDAIQVTEAEEDDDEDKIISQCFSLHCKECKIKIETFHKLLTHYKTVHNSKGFIECCKKKFCSKSTAVRHAKSHVKPEQLTCAVCELSFKTEKRLIRHMKIHMPETKKSYDCSYCNEKFTKAYMLRQHKVLHEDNQEHKCDECNKIFKSKSSLATHVKMIHERACQQVCDICAKMFSSRSSLQSHYRSFHQYNANEAVECQVCGSILKDKYNHKRHMQRHMESCIPCDICGKECPNTKALRMHKKRSHFDKRDHLCGVCGKGFKRKIVLKEHMATHTGEVSIN